MSKSTDKTDNQFDKTNSIAIFKNSFVIGSYSKMSICSKCVKPIKASDLKACTKCNATFHYQCLGLPIENFTKESKAYKAAWKCSECRTVDKRGESSITPSQSKPTVQILDSPTTDSNVDLKCYIDKKLEESLTKLLREIRRDFTEESSETRSKIQELTDSVNYMTTKYEQLREDLDIKSKKIDNLEIENSDLRSKVTDLNSRLNQFEQHSRDCNLEIQCVPEHKSENLKTVIRQLATTVGYPLPEHELANYHRVAKINQDSNRPRSIVVKLSSPLVRDRFLAAVKTFNRTHPDNKLNSSHLGLADVKKPVYVIEHLSPVNKQLHAAARNVAREKRIQFVWVRNGRIFIRKDLNSKSLLVKDLDFLNSLSFA